MLMKAYMISGKQGVPKKIGLEVDLCISSLYISLTFITDHILVRSLVEP